jgi:hypothetical protein
MDRTDAELLIAGSLSCYSAADLANAGVNVVAEGEDTPIAT